MPSKPVVKFDIEFVFPIHIMSISSSASSGFDDAVEIQEVLAQRSSLTGNHNVFVVLMSLGRLSIIMCKLIAWQESPKC